MIRPLRRVHCRVFLVLAILLPLLLAIALAGRADTPVQHEWPFEGRR